MNRTFRTLLIYGLVFVVVAGLVGRSRPPSDYTAYVKE